MKTFDSLPKDLTLLGMQEVEGKVKLSRAQIYRKIAAGTFPRQVHLSDRRVVFLEVEIVDWINQRVAERKAVAEKIKQRMERLRKRRKAA